VLSEAKLSDAAQLLDALEARRLERRAPGLSIVILPPLGSGGEPKVAFQPPQPAVAARGEPAARGRAGVVKYRGGVAGAAPEALA
jgi:hypothetical protein